MYPVETFSEYIPDKMILVNNVYFKWHDDIYIDFMLDVMYALEPMHADPDKILLSDN